MERKTEAQAMETLCTYLLEMQADADKRGGRVNLDRVVADVVAGGSAVRALRRLDFEDTVRGGRDGDLSALNRLGINTRSPQGSYVCPIRRCARQEDIHEVAGAPNCDLGATRMRFQSVPETR